MNLGCHIDLEKRDAFCAELANAYGDSGRPDLRGFWQVKRSRGKTTIHLHDAERAIFGRTRPRYQQSRGICVKLGFLNAMHASLWSACVRGVIGKPVEIYGTPNYVLAREVYGGGRLGNGDGAFGVDFASSITKNGSLSLSEAGQDRQREDLSVTVKKVSPETKAKMALHLWKAHGGRMTTDQIADCIAAGRGVAMCIPRHFTGRPDKHGICRGTTPGGHCTALTSVFLTPAHKLAFVQRQTWIPTDTYSPTVTTIDGVFNLPDGCNAILAEDIDDMLTQGETYVVDLVKGCEWR